MTKVEVMAMLATVKDIEVYEYEDGDIDVTIQDFEGFDDDWSEIIVDVDASVDAMEEWLSVHCVSRCHDYYSEYEFDGFTVQVGCSSMDI
jgi:hypothetical protein